MFSNKTVRSNFSCFLVVLNGQMTSSYVDRRPLYRNSMGADLYRQISECCPKNQYNIIYILLWWNLFFPQSDWISFNKQTTSFFYPSVAQDGFHNRETDRNWSAGKLHQHITCFNPDAAAHVEKNEKHSSDTWTRALWQSNLVISSPWKQATWQPGLCWQLLRRHASFTHVGHDAGSCYVVMLTISIKGTRPQVTEGLDRAGSEGLHVFFSTVLPK